MTSVFVKCDQEQQIGLTGR